MDTCLDRSAILEIVLRALETANEGRDEGTRLTVSPDAPLFGAESALDSLGLVALLIDIEEAFAIEGRTITLSDERALSQRRSPFRSVSSLVAYIEQLPKEEQG
jgi:acyl carrier protein